MNLKSLKSLFNSLYLGIFSLMVLFPTAAFGAAAEDPAITNCHNFKAQFHGAFDSLPDRYCTSTGLVLFVIQLIVTLAGTATVLWLTLGGFLYLTSAGDEEQSEKGKKIIVNAILGLIVVILAGAAVRIISNLITT